MTARENIAVGRIEHPHSQEEIEYAADKSLAAGVVATLPGGYDQMLGRRFEGGEVVELSFIVFSFYIRFCWSGSVRGVVRPFGSIQRAYGLQAGRGVDDRFFDGSI